MIFLDRLALWLGRTSAWFFAVIVLVMVYEVVAGYAFNTPTIWAHEVYVLLAAFAFVFGGAQCMAEGTYMRITVLVETRPSLSRLSEWLGLVAGVIYLGGLALASWRMAERAIWRFSLSGAWDPERSGSTLNLPLPAYLKAILFAGVVLFLLVVPGRMIPRRRA
jgi:C4-dicarboxylate transporter, DctQ subunit